VQGSAARPAARLTLQGLHSVFLVARMSDDPSARLVNFRREHWLTPDGNDGDAAAAGQRAGSLRAGAAPFRAWPTYHRGAGDRAAVLVTAVAGALGILVSKRHVIAPLLNKAQVTASIAEARDVRPARPTVLIQPPTLDPRMDARLGARHQATKRLRLHADVGNAHFTWVRGIATGSEEADPQLPRVARGAGHGDYRRSNARWRLALHARTRVGPRM